MLSDKHEANLGYVYENTIAQMLVSKGYKLFYYTMKSETSNHLYEVDFLISEGDKISPIEVKSCNYRQHKSLEVFCEKFSRRVKNKSPLRIMLLLMEYISFLYIWFPFLTPEDLRY